MPADVAAEVYASDNVVQLDSVMRGPFPRDMIWLWFRDDASQADRQAAVDSIGGTVVGGYRMRPGGCCESRFVGHSGLTN